MCGRAIQEISETDQASTVKENFAVKCLLSSITPSSSL
jgi:hypothetical protein